MDASGEISAQGVLPGVLRALLVERRTGLLHVTRGAERGSVCFIRGNIVYGDTNIKECHLGEALVRHGLLTQWDRERAGEMVSVTGRRLGQILLDLGLLDADGLEDALALQVREVLLTIFSWPDGRYVFEDQDPDHFRGYDKPLRLSTGEVILDAVWSIADPDVVRFALGDIDRVLLPASDPLLRFQKIALAPTDGFLLSRVDGVMTARELLEIAPVSADEAQRSLFGLLYTGMVEYLPALEPEKRVPEPRIRAAPTPPPPPPADPLPEPVTDQQKIEETLDQAHALLAGGRAWDAIVAVDGVLAGAKGRARRRARVLKAQGRLRGADGRKSAEDELKAALQEDAANPEAHYELGMIYKAGGANALAAASFRRALGLKPRYHEAQAELLALGPPAAPDASGRLRRLLGR